MFLSVTEILCDKVLISLFFKFKMYFHYILRYLKFLKFFQELNKILTTRRESNRKRPIIIFIGSSVLLLYVLLFFNSEFDCGKNLTVHKIYISKLLLCNNRNSHYLCSFKRQFNVLLSLWKINDLKPRMKIIKIRQIY